MIPKVVHFFWFSGEPYPSLIKKCMKSWHKYLPDYKFILWNTKNFDVNINTWTKEAYEQKKYAFLSDYARFYVLYHYGGIYLDSDIEIVKSLDDLLTNHAFIGTEYPTMDIEGEIIGSEPYNPAIKTMLDYYENRHFILQDGSLDQKNLPVILKEIADVYWLCGNNSIKIYPKGFFIAHPHFFLVEEIPFHNEITYSIHYGAGYGWRNDYKSYCIKVFNILILRNSIVILKYLNKINMVKLYRNLLKLLQFISHHK